MPKKSCNVTGSVADIYQLSVNRKDLEVSKLLGDTCTTNISTLTSWYKNKHKIDLSQSVYADKLIFLKWKMFRNKKKAEFMLTIYI